MLRLNKYLSEAGVCSRREADRLIEQGRVKVDGTPATVGMQVDEHAQITVDGKAVGEKKQKTILIAVNKPRGIVCSEAHQGNDTNIIEFLQYPKRITYMGRLDKDSEGLLLMTNRGDLINEMMRAAHYHEKEYEVVVDRPFTDRFLNDLAAGVYLKELDVTTRPCQVQRLGKRKFSIVLTQGLNRQIRRMCGELGYHVQELKRTRIMNIRLGHLKTGTWRNVTEEELQELLYLLEESGAEAAEAAETEAKSLKAKYEDSLKNAHDESISILNKAKINARAEYDRIVGEADGEAQKIVSKARTDMEQEREQALKEVKTEIGDLIALAVDKVAGTKASAESDKELIDQFLSDVDADDK